MFSRAFKNLSCGLFFFSVCVFMMSDIAWCNAYKNAYKEVRSEKDIKQYQSKIRSLNQQINFTKSEANWLDLKFKKLNAAGQYIPYKLKQSMDLKKHKIQRLAKYRDQLKKIVDQYTRKQETGLSNHGVPEIKQRKTLTEKDLSKLPFDKSRLEKAIQKEDLNQWVNISEAGKILKIETELPILFTQGSDRISDEYKPFFKKFADFLKSYNIKVIVNGYTDPVPINTEKFPSNFELGAARAAKVVHEFVKQGLKPSIFKIATTGEHRFLAQKPHSSHSFERRVQISVLFYGKA